MSGRSLKATLEALYTGRSLRHLANDPLSFCHRYADPADREVTALIAAVFAYGSVAVIKGSLERIFDQLGRSPARFVDRFEPLRQSEAFAGFKHRFNSADDLRALLWAIRQMRQQAGSIERFFARFHDPRAETVEAGLNGFSAAVLHLDYRTVFGPTGLDADSSFRFLFPAPAGGSACKRSCMFLRWVARPADGIDLGLWTTVRPSQLVIPVDRHIERIGRLLGLTTRRTPDWRMALEITAGLRRLAPDDPIRYDFSICHLGISEGCSGKSGPTCRKCPIAAHCQRRSDG
ncbi:MAG: TIGR02757 family protein [Geobacter sp.]|uniref:TIGR02757 family protein n=1 Tax=Trichlorobacter sp. TaxID=2911007 RepID=UPI002A369024|nr:TIGR02757 family protein [Trichlorobacter sp.]MDY0384212.1 TIGR02757 family protein [Trichlorobacter sp.]